MWFARGVSGPGSNGSKPDVFVACLFQHSCRGLAGLRRSQASRAATVEQGKCAQPRKPERGMIGLDFTIGGGGQPERWFAKRERWFAKRE